MSRPGYYDPKAKHNDAYANNDGDSLSDMGDLPVNINDLNDVDKFEDRAIDPDEVDIESMVDDGNLLQEGVAFKPEAMHPHQYVRPKER